MKISIFGLGYVGCVTGAVLADEGHTVIGIDKRSYKLERIRQGKSPIKEKGLDEVIERVVKQGRFLVTANPEEAVVNTDVSIICVGTPSSDNGRVSLTAVKEVTQQIGSTLSIKRSFHVVVLRSTVPPNSTESKIIPLLEQSSGRKAGMDFGVCFNPEFLREGSALYDIYNPARTIVATTDDRSKAVMESLYHGIRAPLVVTSFPVAETVKYVDNTFHALKICFANEIGNLCKSLGIDGHEVMRIFCLDRKLNLSPTYFSPGFAFGGSCLPKDLRAMLYEARQHNCDTPLLQSILESNKAQLSLGIELILKTGKRKIGLFGLSFKPGTDDLRESPMLSVAQTLLAEGREVYIYDSNISTSEIYGVNREYAERKIKRLHDYLCPSMEEVVTKAEVLVIGHADKNFTKILKMMSSEQVLIDLAGVI